MPVELLIRTAQLDYEHLDPQAQQGVDHGGRQVSGETAV
jgi:hypothetical protein